MHATPPRFPIFSLALIGVNTLALAMGSEGSEPAPAEKAEHVVVMVWDGMRPDFITPQYAPTLYALATRGVFFRNHHPVYVSSTEVNGAALATGVYPNRNGILANTEYRPQLAWLVPNATEGIEFVRRGDLMSNGHYLLVPTVAEILQAAGHPTIIAGTKPVVILHDRSASRASGAAAGSTVLYAGHTMPRAALEALVKSNDDKQFPARTIPNSAQDAWTTRALTHGLWKKGLPKYTLLWLSDPDASQHENGPGSPQALAAIESCDKNLASVLKTLEDMKQLSKTDVMVVSDHGFSTIQRGPDVAEILKKAGFVSTKSFEDPAAGDVMVVGLGGSVFLYVVDRQEPIIRKLVEFLQTTDFAGVIFSRIPIEGTFPLEQVRTGSDSGPDVIVSMRWSAEKNEHGTPGLQVCEGGTKGKGHHVSLSHFDMHNTLVAAGPDFKQGFIDQLPSGNADLAPTILRILGVPQPSSSPMDGRVLEEALVSGTPYREPAKTETLEASRQLGLFYWRQYLKITRFAGAIYFDEGNGQPEAR
jgi:arylsulfatase A-like enzyme